MERRTSVKSGQAQRLLSSPSLMLPVQVHGPDELPVLHASNTHR